MLLKDFKIHSFLPPGISILGGKTYVVPGWYEVPEGTTLKEVQKHWTQELPPMENKPKVEIREMVDSSTGNGKQYEVTFDGQWWSCTCPGFGFRRDCRHLKAVKEKYNIK